MAFIKRQENFVCEHCGASVVGSGYTNHCPVCLWSKHVDVDPGDRKEPCAGLMRPIEIEGSSPHYTLVHRCERCGAVRRVKTAANDSAEALLALARNKSNSS